MDDFLIDLEKLPLNKRMAIKGGWPEWVSITDLANKAIYPDDAEKARNCIGHIVQLCMDDKLKCYGDIRGWEWGVNQFNGGKQNPYPNVHGKQVDAHYGSGENFLYNAYVNKSRAKPSDCLIHRDEFQRYLKKAEKWPASGLLANWFHESDSEVETVGNDGAGSRGDTEQVNQEYAEYTIRTNSLWSA